MNMSTNRKIPASPPPYRVTELRSPPSTRSSSPLTEQKFRPRPITVDTPIHVHRSNCLHGRKKCVECFGEETEPTPVYSETVHVPCFREVDDGRNESTVKPTRKMRARKSKFKRPMSTYVVYEEPDWDTMTEYDADSDDEEFLASYFSSSTSIETSRILEFEMLVDSFEKAAFYQFECMDASEVRQMPELEEEQTCCICNHSQIDSSDCIVECHGCHILVHEDCYQSSHSPQSRVWYCKWCASNRATPWKVGQCVLCSELGGALRQTKEGEWCHIVCAMWMPNATVEDGIIGLDKVKRKAWNVMCSICSKRSGACVQCSEECCNKWFHVMCARSRGRVTDVIERFGKHQYLSFCAKHSFDYWIEGKKRERERQFIMSLDGESILSHPLVQERSSQLAKSYVRDVLNHWLIKRKREGRPLLKRLELSTSYRSDFAIDTSSLDINSVELELAAMRKLRENMELLRLLLDMSWQRERKKLQILSTNIDYYFAAQEQHERLSAQSTQQRRSQRRISHRFSPIQYISDDSEEEEIVHAISIPAFANGNLKNSTENSNSTPSKPPHSKPHKSKPHKKKELIELKDNSNDRRPKSSAQQVNNKHKKQSTKSPLHPIPSGQIPMNGSLPNGHIKQSSTNNYNTVKRRRHSTEITHANSNKFQHIANSKSVFTSKGKSTSSGSSIPATTTSGGLTRDARGRFARVTTQALKTGRKKAMDTFKTPVVGNKRKLVDSSKHSPKTKRICKK